MEERYKRNFRFKSSGEFDLTDESNHPECGWMYFANDSKRSSGTD